MSEMQRIVVEDLRSWSEDLLEPGFDDKAQISGHSGVDTPVLARAGRFMALLHRLIAEIANFYDPTKVELRISRKPLRALASRRPSDYELRDTDLVPTRWIQEIPLAEPAEDPLSWLLAFVGELSSQLATALERHDKMARQVVYARGSGNRWYKDEAPALTARRQSLLAALANMSRARSIICDSSSEKLRPSRRVPSPFPNSPSWLALRKQALDVFDPNADSHGKVRQILHSSVETADLPFLYQRWCGMKMFEALESLGFERLDDPIGPLFLGGRVRLRQEATRIDLWVESRLRRGRRHSSGMTCVEGNEASPDYLLLTDGPQGKDAYVLDATMSTDIDSMEAKGNYFERIASFDLGLAAGVPTGNRAPLRSWAMAPFVAPHCRILGRSDRSGRMGAIPMPPRHYDPDPLRKFLKDIARHGHAWATPGTGSRFSGS